MQEHYHVVFKEGTGVGVLNEAITLAKRLGAKFFTFYVDDRLFKSRLVKHGVQRKALSDAPRGIGLVDGVKGIQEILEAVSAYQRLLESTHDGEAKTQDFDHLKIKVDKKKVSSKSKPKRIYKVVGKTPVEEVKPEVDLKTNPNETEEQFKQEQSQSDSKAENTAAEELA